MILLFLLLFIDTPTTQIYTLSLHDALPIFSPEVQLKLSRITGLAPSNIETLELMSQNEIKTLHLDEQDYFRKILLWDVMPRKHLYEEIMQEVHEDFKKSKTRAN